MFEPKKGAVTIIKGSITSFTFSIIIGFSLKRAYSAAIGINFMVSHFEAGKCLAAH